MQQQQQSQMPDAQRGKARSAAIPIKPPPGLFSNLYPIGNHYYFLGLIVASEMFILAFTEGSII